MRKYFKGDKITLITFKWNCHDIHIDFLMLMLVKLFYVFGQVHPDADRPPHLRVKMYEFAGRVVGKCLYESALGGAYKQLVRARFTRSFLAQIIGLRMNYKVTIDS